MLAAECRTHIHPLKTAIRINNQRRKRHGKNRHQKNDDAETTYQNSHVHSPLTLPCPLFWTRHCHVWTEPTLRGEFMWGSGRLMGRADYCIQVGDVCFQKYHAVYSVRDRIFHRDKINEFAGRRLSEIYLSFEQQLRALIGLPLSIVRNAADMKVFHFGQIRPHGSGKGTVGEYAIHVQCAWRIVSEDAIFTGTTDRHMESSEGIEVNYDDPRAGTLQYVQIGQLLQGYDNVTKSFVNATDHLVVISVSLDRYGSADLLLSGGYRLQIFPDGSKSENWRFFAIEGHHIVVEGSRIDIGD